MKDKKGNVNVTAKDLPAGAEIKDFRQSMQWRIFRIMAEFVEGFEFIANLKKSVTVFGSTRDSKATHQWQDEARKLGSMLAKEGFVVVTGGGPGIMESANHGAAEMDGLSVGLNIQLPMEQRINPYVNHAKGFHYFFTRKLMLTYSAQAYVYFPGGFGTLDEFFEIVTLIQTKKLATYIPVILVGREFWELFDQWLKTVVQEHNQAIDAEDRQIYTIVDSAEEAMEIIRKSPERVSF
ncbi:MAG: Rossman fold protein, TIGR00730 family [Candidatus Liptonbacteria bacterium RIFCSPHIGHO2_01_FULL_57_28]|uniref:Cytokinin riboside 5'-monophosphate phosphoribohydrolase n=1 Tax=Candidatus Liptonbacteria bacterium RIFCSPHIGHO2_01_FULL_57_28 TaxID=1798647 RepID=A0A1G2CBL9_9BACT|nr:MAG: Rossman fold protein, TIGR00730 family [Candidatus Liptonbacteria bacterium RIFCSPHIGHO2_01_FULL_57_28]